MSASITYLSSFSSFNVSTWPRRLLRFWYLHQVEISIPEFFFHSTTFSPRNQTSKFEPQPRPASLAKFLGLVTDDVESGILASEVLCLHEFRIINSSVLLGDGCLVQIPHDFLPLGNHCFYG